MSIPLHRFHGGIHPTENKHQSTQSPIRSLPLPERLVLPLRQHSGQAAEAVVAVGDKVLKGQLIATAKGNRSLNLHAPTSGAISAIEPHAIAHSSGLQELCISLVPDGQDQWQATSSLLAQHGVQSIKELDPAELLQHIQAAGIAGLGGAGFPTHIKLAGSRQDIHTLIINAAECEPYITADDMLMRERAGDILQGIEVLLHISQAQRCLIGIEDNKPEALAALTAANQNPLISEVSIPTLYPSGGEKQLIKILTGEEVPSGGIPAHIGVLCQNVGTAEAIYKAVFLGQPLISRITTVTGDAIAQQGNYETLIGTLIPHVLAHTGYQPQPTERIILGGPLMGFALPDSQVPLSKTSNCILAPTLKELPLNEQAMECIRCGQCVEACPQELLPQQLYWFSKSQDHAKAMQHNIFDCIECGACSFVCPSHIPLVQYYRFSKGEIRAEQAAAAKSERARQRFENRNERIARLDAEREAARLARAQAKAAADALKAQQAEVQAAAPTASSETTAEELQRKILAQTDRVKKAQKSYDSALSAGLDTAPILLKAVEKQQQKLSSLEQELQALSVN